MRALSAAELLQVWERGMAQSPAQRALALLAIACVGTPVDQISQLTIGQRDTHLLALREQTFGPQLASLATCPACRERLEITINSDDIRATTATDLPGTFTVTQWDYDVQFRLPNSLDIESLDPAADSETNRQHLLQRCVITAKRADADVTSLELPAEVVAAIAQRMAEADPQADVQLSLACPECLHAWHAPLDILSYFWTEIHASATRILREVHVLATAYGWREADVLALSPWRRQAYLEMIEQ